MNKEDIIRDVEGVIGISQVPDSEDRTGDFMLFRLDDAEGGASLKNARSEICVHGASVVFRKLAQWALNYECGKMLDGCDPESMCLARSGYVMSKNDGLDANYEEVGASIFSDSKLWYGLEPALRRRVLARILFLMSGALSVDRSFEELASALVALDHGEVLPILQPSAVKRHGAGYRLAQLRLDAVCFVVFLTKRGFKKHVSRKKVASYFGCSVETLISWEKRIPKAVGEDRYYTRIHDAELCAVVDGEQAPGLWYFDDENMIRTGQEYIDTLKEGVE